MTVIAAVPRRPSVLSGRYRAPTLGIVLTVTLLAFEEMAVNTVMPVTARDLNGLSLYAWGFSALFIMSLFANVVGGRWADARGPARPLLCGLAVFVVGLLIAGAAPAMWWFILGRAVQGLGAGTAIVAIYVLVARVYPESIRPRVFAAMSAAWVVPSLVGPSIGGFVAEHLGWRWVFLGLTPLVVPAVAMTAPVLRGGTRESATPERGRVPAAAAVAVGAGLLLYGIDTGPVLVVLPGLAGLAFGLRKLLPGGTVRLRRGLPTVIAMRGLLMGAFAGTEAFIPLGLTSLHGFTPTTAGVVLTAGALGWSGASWYQGRSTAARSRFVILGAALLAVGVLGAVLALQLSGWFALPAWIFAGAGMGFGTSSVSVLALGLSAPAEQGTNSAALQISDTLGASLVVGLAGALAAGFGTGRLQLGLATAGSLTVFIAVVAALTAHRVEVSHA